MNVVIQGAGVIGRVTGRLLETRGHTITYHDPPLRLRAEPQDVCVVCTPCRDGHLDDPEWAAESEQIVVRSTVVPEAFDPLPYRRRFRWPEFLTERYADEEVFTPDKIVWGSDRPDARLLESLLGTAVLTDPRTVITTIRAACVAKLAVNAIYTTKVLINNVIHDAVRGQPGEYAAVMAALDRDKRITVSHEDIWQDGYRGAGGRCLPKDTGLLAIAANASPSSWSRRFLNGLLEANTELLGRSTATDDATVELAIEEVTPSSHPAR